VSHQGVQRRGVDGLPELIRELRAVGVHGLKIRQALSDDDLRTVFSEAAAAGLPVYGHTYDWPGRDSVKEYTMTAVRLGAAGVMHVSGFPQVGPDAPPPPDGPRFGSDNWQQWWLHQAALWLHGDSAAEGALIDAMVARGAWLEPTLVTEDWLAFADRYRSEWVARGLPRTHADAFTGFPTWTGPDLDRFRGAFEKMQDFVRRFHERGGTVIAGSDCLPSCGQGVHEEIALLARAGLPPLAALQAATLSAARALGRGHELGAVEVEYLADLLLLDANPLEDVRNTRRIAGVISGGKWVEGR
jgi:imidazolonepropionase-like amidohydrolase